MIVKQYIKDFENLGFGMFVHFGLYSILGTAEWSKRSLCISDEDYEPLMEQFNPRKDWATELVKLAKNAGCKYITLTTRHHDGFSLFDTCGLNTYDAPHSLCGRDLVREFADACNQEGIISFFYHTLLDWREKSYNTDFPKYLQYLRDSVEIICKNYGKIGGIWFDGMWDKPAGTDWEEDALYSTIRKYQPEAMIVMLMNVGPMADGSVREMDKAILNLMGRWVAYFGEAIYKPVPTEIEIEGKPNDFILKEGNAYYLFCSYLSVRGDENVVIPAEIGFDSRFQLADEIESVTWLDNNESVRFEQNGSNVIVKAEPYPYGRSLVVRVAKIICKSCESLMKRMEQFGLWEMRRRQTSIIPGNPFMQMYVLK